MSLVVIISLCYLEQVTAEEECPLGFYTPDNATKPCSKCWPVFAHCTGTTASIDMSLILTKSVNFPTLDNSSLFVGQIIFDLDRSKGILSKHMSYISGLTE